ncbi:hypothetical protein H257_19357, partial [Aphanomyces astaci]
MYHVGGREVTEDFEAQIAFGDGEFHVERLDEARCVDGQHQVLVKWLGLDDEESSWGPTANLLDDIPVVFRKWAASNKEDPVVAALIKTLDFPLEGKCSAACRAIGSRVPWPKAKKKRETKHPRHFESGGLVAADNLVLSQGSNGHGESEK